LLPPRFQLGQLFLFFEIVCHSYLKFVQRER